MRNRKICESYEEIVLCWYSPPNNLPIFKNEFFERCCVIKNVIDIELTECMRHQLIAIRERLTD